jgi:hypothetical protein
MWCRVCSAEATEERAISREGASAISSAFRKKTPYKSMFLRSGSNHAVFNSVRIDGDLYITDSKDFLYDIM